MLNGQKRPKKGPSLTDDDIENRRAAVRKMKKHLYLDICGVENIAEESSFFSNKKFNYQRNRTTNVNVFKNAFPAVFVGNIQVRPLGVNETVNIPMTTWEKYPELWGIILVFIIMAGICFLCALAGFLNQCLNNSDQRNEEAVEQELRNLNLNGRDGEEKTYDENGKPPPYEEER